MKAGVGVLGMIACEFGLDGIDQLMVVDEDCVFISEQVGELLCDRQFACAGEAVDPYERCGCHCDLGTMT